MVAMDSGKAKKIGNTNLVHIPALSAGEHEIRIFSTSPSGSDTKTFKFNVDESVHIEPQSDSNIPLITLLLVASYIVFAYLNITLDRKRKRAESTNHRLLNYINELETDLVLYENHNAISSNQFYELPLKESFPLEMPEAALKTELIEEINKLTKLLFKDKLTKSKHHYSTDKHLSLRNKKNLWTIYAIIVNTTEAHTNKYIIDASSDGDEYHLMITIIGQIPDDTIKTMQRLLDHYNKSISIETTPIPEGYLISIITEN